MPRGSATSNATFNLSNNATLATLSDLDVDNGGTGVFNQTGGTANIGGWLYVGTASTGHGTYNMGGGKVTATRIVLSATTSSSPANAGTGSLNQTGGVVNCNLDVDVGNSSGGTGIYTISGPSSGPNAVTLNAGVTGTVASGGEGLQIGWNATGVFNQNGGIVNAMRTGVGFNGDVLGNGTYNLSGGVLTTAAIFKVSDGGTATFNFNGGTV